MTMKKFDRKLGTSKREQGVVTRKQPRPMKCGCVKRNDNDGRGWYYEYYCHLHDPLFT
jgi:hypothetical protein